MTKIEKFTEQVIVLGTMAVVLTAGGLLLHAISILNSI